MSMSYHTEALRKTRALERKQEALRALRERVAQQSDEMPAEVEKQMKIVHSEPGHYQQTRLQYYLVGRERDRMQYDHSRYGPVTDRTFHQLKTEFNRMGQSLRSTNLDIVLASSPRPRGRHTYRY